MNPQELAAFARDRVLPSREERSGAFDRSLWREMADLGLIGAVIAAEHGGRGGEVSAFARDMALLAEEGLDLGLVLSLVDHVMLCAWPLQVFGSPDLKRRYLPRLCSGELVGAAAISEPGSGGDPSRMQASAAEERGGYRVSGVKEPITNAPAADLFLLLASTDAAAGKEGLSAFLVERAWGVEVEDIELGFLSTSPHGRVVLDGVEVPAGNLLGERGWGHVRVSRSMFVWERAALMPALAALMLRWHGLIVSRLEPARISPRARGLLARRRVEATACRVVGERLLELAFAGEDGGGERMELLAFLGGALPGWLRSMREVLREAGLCLDGDAAAVGADLRLLEVGVPALERQMQRLLPWRGPAAYAGPGGGR